jgi:hypothetical protein
MNKTLSVIILGLILLSSIGLVSAAETRVSGKIYDASTNATVSGASVTVTCNEHTLTATSAANGFYRVIFQNEGEEHICWVEDSVTIYAEKDGKYGSRSGSINSNEAYSYDFAVINVPLVPEFGAVVGALTLLSAVGVFFLIRRK